MRLSVAHTFAPGLAQRLACFPEVKELFGKMDRDIIGGGRSSYTLRSVSARRLAKEVRTVHDLGLKFNYLLNAATLGGLEQSAFGQRKIRSFLDFLSKISVDSVTVASPYLLRLIKSQYPHFSVRVGVFAVIDSVGKAREWQDYGADTLCLSAIACNRDFETLHAIRQAVTCDLQLIANATCLLNCAYELTHMNLLSASSRKGDRLKGFCLDYCILNCSKKRLQDPIHFVRATWIRPEDLRLYEQIGYDNFKIVERSCPSDLLVRRVEAYTKRSFKGNLLEIVGPVAQIKKEQGASLLQRLKIAKYIFRRGRVNLKSLRSIRDYAHALLPVSYEKSNTPVYMDNEKLEAFLEGLKAIKCRYLDCRRCGYCASFAEKAVTVDPSYTKRMLETAEPIEQGLYSGSLWE